LSTLSVGQEVIGKIVRLSDFGVFIDIGGIDALIPASELSWRRFKKPEEILSVGQELRAKIFRIDTEKKKLAASVKDIEPDPWTVIPETLQEGACLNAKVITQAEFGVFLEVLPGVEALLHKSNLPEGMELPAIGDELEVQVISIEVSKKRMGLSLKVKDDLKTQEQEAEETKEFEHVN
jgi:small subunit ribosomal protein S1